MLSRNIFLHDLVSLVRAVQTHIKNLKSGSFRVFRVFNFSSQKFHFFKSKSVNLFELIGAAIIL